MAHEDKVWPITTWRRPIGEKCVAQEDKGWPITTWRRPIGEKKCVAHEDKGRPITTWRRPIGVIPGQMGPFLANFALTPSDFFYIWHTCRYCLETTTHQI